MLRKVICVFVFTVLYSFAVTAALAALEDQNYIFDGAPSLATKNSTDAEPKEKDVQTSIYIRDRHKSRKPPK